MRGRVQKGSEKVKSSETERLNYLISQGHSLPMAMNILEGNYDEEVADEILNDLRAAEEWVANEGNLKQRLTPVWNFDPDSFFHSLDGASPKDFDPSIFSVVEVSSKSLLRVLPEACQLTADPWSVEFREKSKTTAYRWAVGKPVSPPIICMNEGILVVEGGFHRLRLAIFHKCESAPVLVRGVDERAAMHGLSA